MRSLLITHSVIITIIRSLIAMERSILGIVKCKICGLIYVNPRLKSPEKIYWADKEDYYEEARLISERLSGNLKD